MKNFSISGPSQRPFNLLTLPLLQRQILVYLAREGPTNRDTLAVALDQTPAALQTTVTALIKLGALTQTIDGHLEAHWGRRRRRSLPARLWPALQTANRLYSAQEIATLRTVVPILQFARAKLGEFTDHGPGHVLRVKMFATQLGSILGLSATEQHLLRAAALFHDVGNVVERARHHIISQEAVEKLAANGQIPFSQREAALVGLLCRWHRKAYEPERTDDYHGETVRTGLLASILRVADALDSDYRRFDYSDKFMGVIEFFYPHEIPYWQGLAEILGIRLCCTSAIQLQVFVHAQTKIDMNFHIQALRKDVDDTPFAWPVQVIRGNPPQDTSAAQPPIHPLGVALVVCPFDPHSLVMAALSRKQLAAAGYRVELLIYADTDGASAWLWGEALADFAPSDFSQLVVIGDRPDATIGPTVLATLARWRSSDITCTVLNRHEATWARLPELLALGVQAKLGGDWAYFWGDAVDEADFFWSRIAALCTRDPIQSTVGLTPEEQTMSHGLLRVIYAAAEQSPAELDRWLALATPILDAIEADDRPWFAAQADEFERTYTTVAIPARVNGKVLHFDLATKPTTPAIFWGLEAAIEAQGRTAERGICFQTPYAIATWPVGAAEQARADDLVEIVAINHWREEEAIPIRLLYPTDLGATPEGNESALRVCLPAVQAAQVVQTLLAACNQPTGKYS